MYKKYSKMKFDDIEQEVRKIFSKKGEIIAAYLYGSFLYSDFYKDIDIGLLINDRFKCTVLYEVKLAGELERAFQKPFNTFKPIDIRVLNRKPLRFLFSVLKNSKVIYSMNDQKRFKFEARIMKEYIDIKPHHENYDKMRILRYENK